MTPRHFLNIQSQHNWMADRANGFLLLNVSERKRPTAATLCKGDYIVTFVSGGGFADVRCVTGTRLRLAKNPSPGNEAASYVLETIPVAAIHPDHHFPAALLANRLGISCKDAPERRPTQALQLMTQEDGLLLVSLIVATAKAERNAIIPNWSNHKDQKRVACA